MADDKMRDLDFYNSIMDSPLEPFTRTIDALMELFYRIESLENNKKSAESAQDAKYRACVEALHNNLRDIERFNEFAHRNGLPAFDLMEEETRKALSDLDEAREGEKNGRQRTEENPV